MVVTLVKVPPPVRASLKFKIYSPTTAPPEAVSDKVIVHSFEDPVAGIVGVKAMSMFSEVPRLSMYSTDRGWAVPGIDESVSFAGKLTEMFICVVG